MKTTKRLLMTSLIVICCKTISTNTKDNHVDSYLCKIRRNIHRYSELFGGYRIMYKKLIANGDVGFDGEIK